VNGTNQQKDDEPLFDVSAEHVEEPGIICCEC